MIQTAFKSFALAACAARVAEATEHVRAETRRIEHPDVTVLELLRAKGFTSQSHVVRILGELVGVHEALSLFDEWRDYRFELRLDPAVHKRYFEHIEESNMFPGNYSDRCFLNVTLDNMYDNALWRLARPKPRKQTRFVALIHAMQCLDWAEERATGRTAKKVRMEVAKPLNSDAGLLDPRTVEDALTLERADATMSLETMRTEWNKATEELAVHTADVTRALDAIDVEQLRGLLANTAHTLSTLPDCRPAKNELREYATKAFETTARNLIRSHMVALEAVPDLEFGATFKQAAEDTNSTLVELRAQEQPPLDMLKARVLDWLRRDYTVTSRSVVRTAMTNYSSIAARALQATHAFDQINGHVKAMTEITQTVADRIAALPPLERGTDRAVEVHVAWLMRVCAYEHVRDVMSRLLSPDEHKSLAELGGKAVRAQLVARLRQAWTDVQDFTRGMQFVQQYVETVQVPDVDLLLLVGKQSAGAFIATVRSQLEERIVPSLAECKEDVLDAFRPVPVVVDMAAATGTWLVDKTVFRDFVDKHLLPAVDELRVHMSVEDDDDDEQHIQALLLLADAEQLASAQTPPTFRRVFQAVRCVHQLQLSSATSASAAAGQSGEQPRA